MGVPCPCAIRSAAIQQVDQDGLEAEEQLRVTGRGCGDDDVRVHRVPVLDQDGCARHQVADQLGEDGFALGNVVEGENPIIGEAIERPDDRVGAIIGDDGENLAIQGSKIESGIEFTAGDGVAA